MPRTVVASILHGAYGDLYEQAICLKHFALTHPEVELRLFAATPVRLAAFQALDLSFASSFQMWTELLQQEDIDSFFQFQVADVELVADVLNHLPPELLAKLDRSSNRLPWDYLGEHRLIPAPDAMQLPLSESGLRDLPRVMEGNAIPEDIWSRPTISFLWRYRTRIASGHGISNLGQKPADKLVDTYSNLFQTLLDETGGHLLVFGMNLVPSDSDRVRTDNKFSTFGLKIPSDRVTYLKGLSWPLELEIASRATLCCGNPSGFTEALWLKLGKKFMLMDPPPVYLAKLGKHRLNFYGYNSRLKLAEAFLRNSQGYYLSKARGILSSAT